MTTHLRRIEAVEKDLKALSSGSSKREDIGRLREEMKKVHVGVAERSGWGGWSKAGRLKRGHGKCRAARTAVCCRSAMSSTQPGPLAPLVPHPAAAYLRTMPCADDQYVRRMGCTARSSISARTSGAWSRTCTRAPVPVGGLSLSGKAKDMI